MLHVLLVQAERDDTHGTLEEVEVDQTEVKDLNWVQEAVLNRPRSSPRRATRLKEDDNILSLWKEGEFRKRSLDRLQTIRKIAAVQC